MTVLRVETTKPESYASQASDACIRQLISSLQCLVRGSISTEPHQAIENQKMDESKHQQGTTSTANSLKHLRFQSSYQHLRSVFGDDWFALKAEAFARFFGTPTFLIGQTLIVMVWIAANATGFLTFDVYPFILLNLAFSLQAAYAAPLILLAQTRQADRDSASTAADAHHRESLAQENSAQLQLIQQQSVQLIELMKQNTALTEATKELSIKIESLTTDLHRRIAKD